MWREVPVVAQLSYESVDDLNRRSQAYNILKMPFITKRMKEQRRESVLSPNLLYFGVIRL
jgi:hypothetical protein